MRGRRRNAAGSSAHSLSSQKVDRKNPWVGLLARKVANALRIHRLLHLPRPDRPSGYSKQRAFTYSGGTAPDFHRTSLLRPRGHPRPVQMLTHTRSSERDRNFRRCRSAQLSMTAAETHATLVIADALSRTPAREIRSRPSSDTFRDVDDRHAANP
jgi:hypothetical protein